MPDLSRAQLLGYLAAGLAVVVLGALWVRAGSAPSAGAGGGTVAAPVVRVAGPAARPGGGSIVVHVAGAVRRPGVYRLHAGSRVGAAVRRAGGADPRADLDALNLAAKLEDGRQVLVPERAAPAAGAVAGDPAASAAAPGAAGPPVNLNSATAEELGTLDGVGPATAEKILAYRQEHGGFGSVDELDQVPGIGPKRLAALRDHVTV